MKMTGNTILITGGSTGIGLSLADRFLKAGNRVLICGRRKDRLEEAEKAHPGLRTFVCDVSKQADREALFAYAVREFPGINVLFNNAGVMRFMRLEGSQAWDVPAEEIATNLTAPIHLSMLFAGHLAGQRDAVILNTTSGLSHVPLASAPVYSATKAALHSFTQSLRRQLAEKGIKVVEVCPPHVNTDLGVPGANGAGMDLQAYIDSVMAGLEKGDEEITVGFSAIASRAGREEKERMFAQLNGMR
ncbi:MAG: SDR family NAD(P)-dependent oxidoreductase [Fibrobacteria bacterium]